MFLGADVVMLREASRQCTTRAGQLEEIASAALGRVVAASWHGPDAESFRAQAHSVLADEMQSVVQQLTRQGRDLEAAAEQQDQASAPEAARQEFTGPLGGPFAADPDAVRRAGDRVRELGREAEKEIFGWAARGAEGIQDFAEKHGPHLGDPGVIRPGSPGDGIAPRMPEPWLPGDPLPGLDHLDEKARQVRDLFDRVTGPGTIGIGRPIDPTIGGIRSGS